MRQRDLTEGQLVTAGGDKPEAGIVSSWNKTTAFVQYWNGKTGCFDPTPVPTAIGDLKRGGEIRWIATIGRRPETP